MPTSRLEEPTVPATAPLWAPSPMLHAQLFAGMMAVLAAGALSILASLVQIREGLKPGFTLAHGFEWASLVPLVAVLRTYQYLARELDNTGLRRSALGLFGTVVLFEILELATLNAFPLWGEILIWILFGIGLFAVLTASLAPEADMAAPAPKKKRKASDTAAETNRARWGGSLVLGLLILLKLAGKGLFLKFLAVRMIFNLGGHWVLLAGGLLTLLMAGFTVWFAAVKVRLRDRLGSLAALLGVVEIVLLVAFVGFYAWSLVHFEAACQRPGANVPALETEMVRSLNGASMAVDLTWSTLTALLFWSLRARFNPDQEWLLDEPLSD